MSGTSKQNHTEILWKLICGKMRERSNTERTTILEEKIVVFIASAKILEREESVSPSSFYRKLPDY